jgi:hypothetical protein
VVAYFDAHAWPACIGIWSWQVLGKYRGRANTGKYLDWKEWIPAEALTNLPQKEKGTYKGLIKTPNYWREGRNNLFEHYDQLGMHWSDPDGYVVYFLIIFPRCLFVATPCSSCKVRFNQLLPMFALPLFSDTIHARLIFTTLELFCNLTRFHPKICVPYVVPGTTSSSGICLLTGGCRSTAAKRPPVARLRGIQGPPHTPSELW